MTTMEAKVPTNNSFLFSALSRKVDFGDAKSWSNELDGGDSGAASWCDDPDGNASAESWDPDGSASARSWYPSIGDSEISCDAGGSAGAGS